MAASLNRLQFVGEQSQDVVRLSLTVKSAFNALPGIYVTDFAYRYKKIKL